MASEGESESEPESESEEESGPPVTSKPFASVKVPGVDEVEVWPDLVVVVVALTRVGSVAPHCLFAVQAAPHAESPLQASTQPMTSWVHIKYGIV